MLPVLLLSLRTETTEWRLLVCLFALTSWLESPLMISWLFYAHFTCWLVSSIVVWWERLNRFETNWSWTDCITFIRINVRKFSLLLQILIWAPNLRSFDCSKLLDKQVASCMNHTHDTQFMSRFICASLKKTLMALVLIIEHQFIVGTYGKTYWKTRIAPNDHVHSTGGQQNILMLFQLVCQEFNLVVTLMPRSRALSLLLSSHN